MSQTDTPTQPLVAIITPVYNGGAFLRETMESVQAQDYPNLVHVVLDNASTDDTDAIIADYADAKVPVSTARNPELYPLYKNWNTAFELAPKDAKYVRLLCADDKMTTDCTKKMVAVAETDDDILLVGTN
ncbi:MAG: glycosyltransferase family A protein, partial [Pseudomonadota bacterium]